MDNAARRIRQLLSLTLDKGYLAPDHAMAVASKLLEAEPLPDPFALLGTAFIRHAVTLDPFDREKIRLASEVNTRVPHNPFSLWIAMAEDLTANDPVPENIPAPHLDTASHDEILEYMNAQPANAMRYPTMLHLWQAGRYDTFEQAVQIMSGSHSGLLAGPTMAWGAWFANKPLLAEMLLDESVPNFLTLNLQAQMAKGDEKTVLLHASLEIEPFQPATIMALHGNTPISDSHTALGRRMQLADLEQQDDRDLTDTHPDFTSILSELLPYFPPTVRDFWHELLPYQQ